MHKEFGTVNGGMSFLNYSETHRGFCDSLWQSSIHLGRGRKIVDEKPKFHVTVMRRMQSPLKYTPKAQWKADSQVFVH